MKQLKFKIFNPLLKKSDKIKTQVIEGASRLTWTQHKKLWMLTNNEPSLKQIIL